MIYVGNSAITEIYFRNTPITESFIGDVEVYKTEESSPAVIGNIVVYSVQDDKLYHILPNTYDTTTYPTAQYVPVGIVCENQTGETVTMLALTEKSSNWGAWGTAEAAFDANSIQYWASSVEDAKLLDIGQSGTAALVSGNTSPEDFENNSGNINYRQFPADGQHTCAIYSYLYTTSGTNKGEWFVPSAYDFKNFQAEDWTTINSSLSKLSLGVMNPPICLITLTNEGYNPKAYGLNGTVVANDSYPWYVSNYIRPIWKGIIYEKQFQGLTIEPSQVHFTNLITTGSVEIRSSESWTLSVPSWVSASRMSGGKGKVVVNFTANTQSDASGIISATSANYTASTTCDYAQVKMASYIYNSIQSSYNRSIRLDTNIPHNSSAMTVQIEYYGNGGNSDRIVGYQEGDPNCTSDSRDFRIFGYNNGTFDYLTERATLTPINEGEHNLTIGDLFVYDNTNETYLYQGTPIGTIPSEGCHIYVDMSYIKVRSVKIMDGDTVLFDGRAAYAGNTAGLYDSVTSQLVTNPYITITYDPIPSNLE